MACAHDLCRCNEIKVRRDGREFCSEHCANAMKGEEKDNEACTCGDVDCMATEAQ